MKAKPGDKVRIKFAAHYGARAVVERVQGDKLIVRIGETGDVIEVPESETTNYSLAARKAWERMPDRRVGRPKGSRTVDRISVTLRIDRDLWDRFQQAEAQGRIEDRTATINAWIRKRLDQLDNES